MRHFEPTCQPAAALPQASGRVPAILFAWLITAATATLTGCVEDGNAPLAGTGVTVTNGTGTDTGGTPADGGTPPADTGEPPAGTTTLGELGRQLFVETALSSNGTQSCASCHAPADAFVDPDHLRPVSAGAEPGAFGTRNSPTVSYAALVPSFTLAAPAGAPPGAPPRARGGLFLDGRADTAEAQARAPFFNAKEMNLANADELLAKLRSSAARTAFENVYGADSLATGVDAAVVLDRVVAAIAAFERTPAVSPFSSKFDAMRAGTATFSALEQEGMAVFTRADKGNCDVCHTLNAPPGGQPLFSTFVYENLGVPRNPDRRFFAADFVDTGVEATLLGRGVPAAQAANERGRFRVPTLRNVARTAPYMHNGVFSDLRTVVEFYNTRDTAPARWAAIGTPEVTTTINRRDVGNLGLTAHEVDALVAFLQTLDDGYVPSP